MVFLVRNIPSSFGGGKAKDFPRPSIFDGSVGGRLGAVLGLFSDLSILLRDLIDRATALLVL